MTEAWRTVDELRAASRRFAGAIPGFVFPAAYSVARIDGDAVTFGHVNAPGGGHLLPAVVLATVCGHVADTATYPLTAAEFTRAVELLAPAEAATMVEHPNLWSWRPLLAGADAHSAFVAVFVRDLADAPVDAIDAALRSKLAS